MVQEANGKIELNAIILVLTDALGRVFAMVLIIAAARILGAKDFGLLAYATALAGVCLAVSDFGFDRLTVREVSRRPSRASRFFGNISAVKAALYLPAGAACALLALFSSQDYARMLVVMVVFLGLAAQNHMLFGCSFCRAIEKMGLEGLVRLILSLLLLLSGLAVLLAGFGLKTLVVSRLAVSVLCLAFSIVLVRKTIGITFERLSWRYSKTLVKMSARLGIYVILGMLFNSINVIILTFLKGDLSTGYYSAAFRITSLFSVVSVGVSAAALPALSKYRQESPKDFVRSFQKSVRYLLLLSIPLCIGTFLLGGKAIDLIFGVRYLSSVPVIKALALLIIPSFLNNIVNAALISMGKERVMVTGSIVGVAVIPVLCLILIPHWSAVGAALALVIADTVVFFCRFPGVFGEFGVHRQLVTTGRTLLAAGLMGVLLVWLISIGMPLPPLMGLSVLVYSGLLLALGEVKVDEVNSAWEVLQDFVGSFLRRLAFRKSAM